MEVPMRKSVSIGFTIQLDDAAGKPSYEPIKMNIMCERSIKPGEAEEELVLNITKEIMSDLNGVASEIVKRINTIKAQIFEDLSDEGE